MFDAASIFALATMVAGVRFLFEDGTAQQGYADDEESENQAHFTNSAPAIADLDGDGKREPGGPGVGPERVADRS